MRPCVLSETIHGLFVVLHSAAAMRIIQHSMEDTSPVRRGHLELDEPVYDIMVQEGVRTTWQLYESGSPETHSGT